MSVKIKVSYTEDEELVRVIRLLYPAIKSYKIRSQKGRYKLAYINAETKQRFRFYTKKLGDRA